MKKVIFLSIALILVIGAVIIATAEPQETTLKVDGMTCDGCAKHVSTALEGVEGVKSVAVSVKEGTAKVKFDKNATCVDHMKKAVKDAGYVAVLADAKASAAHDCSGHQAVAVEGEAGCCPGATSGCAGAQAGHDCAK